MRKSSTTKDTKAHKGNQFGKSFVVDGVCGRCGLVMLPRSGLLQAKPFLLHAISRRAIRLRL
jgi:hypothetical protein